MIDEILEQYSTKKLSKLIVDMTFSNMTARQIERTMPVIPLIKNYGLTSVLVFPAIAYITSTYIFDRE